LKHSIRNRLLGTTTCVLVVFLTLTGWVLDQSFRLSVTTSAEEQLRLVIYSVMGAVEDDEGVLNVAEGLSEPRLSQPDSGLYAQIADDLNGSLWVSLSTTSEVSFTTPPGEPGTFVFAETPGPLPRYVLSYTVIWEGVDVERITFSAATDQAPFAASIGEFRRSLGLGFALAMVVFVLAQILALRWGLIPLRVMASEVEALEAGEAESLQGGYPRELQGLADNLERFIDHEQRSRARYRNALDDLAHSLKTPLAVIRNTMDTRDPDRSLLTEQLARMEATVMNQLSKASARGPVVVGRPVAIVPQVERLIRALETAYVDKKIEVRLDVTASPAVRGDENDFLEIFGNLVENAFKYAHSQVEIVIAVEGEDAIVRVSDDGGGIPADMRADVLDRGKRLDEMRPGQGIGLAVVAELVDLYGGRLQIEDSQLGGALIEVRLRP
jgi:two-component system sensor histidine kinase PhoQ